MVVWGGKRQGPRPGCSHTQLLFAHLSWRCGTGRPPRRLLDNPVSSIHLLAEATLRGRALGIVAQGKGAPCHTQHLAMVLMSRSTNRVNWSPKLSSPLCLCSPQPPTVERLPSLPDILSEAGVWLCPSV